MLLACLLLASRSNYTAAVAAVVYDKIIANRMLLLVADEPKGHPLCCAERTAKIFQLSRGLDTRSSGNGHLLLIESLQTPDPQLPSSVPSGRCAGRAFFDSFSFFVYYFLSSPPAAVFTIAVDL